MVSLQIFEEIFPLGTYFQYEFLQCPNYSGLVLHIHINKTQGIIIASNKTAYLRRGAQSLPQSTTDKIRRLELIKGVVSFES